MVGWFFLKVFYRKSFPPRRHPEPMERAYKKTKFLCTRKSDEEKVDNLLSLSLWLAFREMLSGYNAFVEECISLFFFLLCPPVKIFAHFRKATPSLTTFLGKNKKKKKKKKKGVKLSSSKPKPMLLRFRYTS